MGMLSRGNGGGVLMLGRWAILGAVILAVQLGRVSTSAEDTPSDDQAISGETAQVEATPETQADQETIEIPLDNIWACQMPRTQDVRELEPEAQRSRHDSLANQLHDSLSNADDAAGPGFVVTGLNREALANAHRVLVKGAERAERFPQESELTLVFFTRSSSQYVHIEQVSRTKGVIEIRYSLVPHETKELTAHFALIPLGELPAGKYEVKLTCVPLKKEFVQTGFKPVDAAYVEKIVCRPFTFLIEPNSR